MTEKNDGKENEVLTRKIGEDNKDKEHEGRSSKYNLDGDSATKHTQ